MIVLISSISNTSKTFALVLYTQWRIHILTGLHKNAHGYIPTLIVNWLTINMHSEENVSFIFLNYMRRTHRASIFLKP